jgi:hypothetical protein
VPVQVQRILQLPCNALTTRLAVCCLLLHHVPVLQWLLLLSSSPDSKPEHFKEAFQTLLVNVGHP